MAFCAWLRHCRTKGHTPFLRANAGVKGLAPVFLGLVFGRGMAAVFGQNTVAGLAAVLAALSVFRSRGNPAHSASIFRAFGALVPGAMSRVDTQYRESAFSIGCQYKIMGNRPLTSRSTGRQKRGAFGSLR